MPAEAKPERRGGARRLAAAAAAAAAAAWLLLRAAAPPQPAPPSAAPPAREFRGTGLALDLLAPSAAHGWVQKEGAASLDAWHFSADGRRRAAWDAHLAARRAGATPMDAPYASVPPHGPDPWGCRLYFSRRYRLLFVRTAKTGSTTVLERVLPTCADRPDAPHCLERVADTRLAASEVEQMWRDYTAFTFTRNVWDRAISQYQYLVHFLRGNGTAEKGGETLNCPRVTWDDFCGDPLALGAPCRAEPRCCSKLWTHQDWHMRQQTSCFATDAGGWAVDFIGRLEHFDDDLRELFAEVNRRRDPALPPLVHEPHPPSNSNPNPCSDAELGADRGGGNARGGKAAAGTTTRRALREFDAIAGNQQSDANYCDRRLFFTRPRHARCFAALSRFFAADVARLHGNLSVAGGRAARED